MPREVIDIKHFTTGVVTNVDEKDLPIDAAYSDLDVDPMAREGILAGRPEDESAVVNYHAKQAILVQQKDGTHDIVYNDVRNGVLGYQTNFYSGRGGDSGMPDTPVELSGAADSDLVAMVQHNGVVRVGKGGNAAAKPQWIGRIDDTTFRGKYEDDYVITDAELTNIVGLPSWYKALIYTGYWIGVSRYGDRIYKIDSSTGAVTVSPVEHRFAKIDAICAEEIVGVHSHLWIGETIGNDYYLKRVSLSTLEITTVLTITNAYDEDHSPENYRFSDILHHLDSAQIFLALTPIEPKKPVSLYKVPYSTSSGPVTLTDISRNINGIYDYFTPGGFSYNRGGTQRVASRVVAGPSVNPICLGLLHGNRVGLTMNTMGTGWTSTEFINNLDYNTSTTTQVATPRVCFVITPTDNTATNKWPIIHYPLLGQDSETNILTAKADAAFSYFMHYAVSSGTGKTRRNRINADLTVLAFNGGAVSGGTEDASITTGATNIVHINQSNFVTVNGPNAYYQTHDDFSNNLLVLHEGNGVEVGFAEFGGNIFEKAEDAKDVYYGIALEYDSQQLSPIWTGFTPQQNKQKGLRLTITLTNLSLINPRVNAIVMYRAFGSLTSTGPEEFYRRWARVEAIDVRWDRSVANEATIILDDDYSETGASYEAATGISEAMESTMVHYGLAAVANGYMVVGNCYHVDVPDASRMLFRSKAQRFDTFNWATDFVALPSPPTALAVYAGRLWAFDQTRAYRVNVEGMFIEDVVEGVGVEDQRCVVETPEGIYAVNSIGLYRLQGQGKMEVSWPVRDIWDTVAEPVLAADESLDTIYVFTTLNGDTRMLVYSRSRNRWDIWSLDTDASAYFEGVFTGKNGEVYYTAYEDTDQNKQYEVCGGVARKTWEWYSREFSFAGQPFKVYRVIVDGTPVPHITTDTVTDKEILGDGTLEANDRKAYKFEFRLHGQGTEEVRSVSVIMRRMVGLR